MPLDLDGTDADLLDPQAVILGEAWEMRGVGGSGSGVGAEESAYTLTRRQERLYTFRADLYEPDVLDVADDQAVSDLAYKMKPSALDVPCWKRESQEENQPSPVGRTNYDISLTIDEFTFPSGVDTNDSWLIKLYPLHPEPLIGAEGDAKGKVQAADNRVQFYVVQGGAQDRPAVGRRQANQRKVFAVKTSPPKTIGGQLLAKKAGG